MSGQVHAHHAHLGLAFEPVKIGLQGQFAAAQHDVVDLVVSQITQGGGEALLAREEVLVDPQHARTAARMPLGELAS